jgi:hypothetical protein
LHFSHDRVVFFGAAPTIVVPHDFAIIAEVTSLVVAVMVTPLAPC